ncbi:histone-lysine N-methyltransferase isoform X1 [Tasmannia lanceolata]|uniref:histone-lysine N-methyltransferase isoform X1 n=1 Tax=Tasmannia lanceolata TaxID=3420 RepID=UPI004063CE95
MEMIKLSRRWRRSRHPQNHPDDKFSLPTRDDFQPIDTREQDELVRSFEERHAQQNFLWRGVFSAFLLCFASFFVFSIIQQASSPWELRYHAYFMDDVESWLVISADWVAVLACLMAVKGLLFHKSKFHKQWIWYSCYTGLLLALFWLYQMLRMPKFRWDIIWLPFGPLSGAGICLYVDHLLAESLQEVRKLRASMYSYKAT